MVRVRQPVDPLVVDRGRRRMADFHTQLRWLAALSEPASAGGARPGALPGLWDGVAGVKGAQVAGSRKGRSSFLLELKRLTDEVETTGREPATFD